MPSLKRIKMFIHTLLYILIDEILCPSTGKTEINPVIESPKKYHWATIQKASFILQDYLLSCLVRKVYVSHRQIAKAQESLWICTVSPQPSLFAHPTERTTWPEASDKEQDIWPHCVAAHAFWRNINHMTPRSLFRTRQLICWTFKYSGSIYNPADLFQHLIQIEPFHGRETNSVVPIIRVYVTHKFNYSNCTKIQKTFGDISVICNRFKYISHQAIIF